MIKKTGMRTASANLAEVGLERLDCLLHFLLSVFLDVSNHFRLQSNMDHRAFIFTHHHPLQGLRFEDTEDIDRELLITATASAPWHP